MTPIATPSRSSGTPSIVRCFPTRAYSCSVYSGSARQSGRWTVRRSTAVRPINDPRPGLNRVLRKVLDVLGLGIVGAGDVVLPVVQPEEESIFRLAKPPRCVEDHINNGLDIGRRAADDTQHLRGRGLLLQCFGKVAGARLHLVEQAHVLDRDHRLVGESSDQLDLLGRKRLGRRSRHRHDAHAASLSKQWNSEHCTESAEFFDPHAKCIPDRQEHRGCGPVRPPAPFAPLVCLGLE